VGERCLRVAVLGSTGSIGRQSLDVIRQLPGRFAVVALAAGRNAELLAAQVAEFRPRYVSAEARSGALDAAIEAAGSRWASMDEMAVADDVDVLRRGQRGFCRPSGHSGSDGRSRSRTRKCW